MKKLKGIGKIFSFTFRQRATSKGYRTAVILGVLLCFLAPALIMLAVDSFGGSDESEEFVPEVSEVFVVDNSRTASIDFSFMNSLGATGLTDVKYTSSGADADGALTLAKASVKSLVLVIDEVGGSYSLSVLLPENTELTRDDADSFAAFLNDAFRFALLQKSGLDAADLMVLTEPIATEITDAGASGVEIDDGDRINDEMRHAFSLVIGYVLVMAMYFMVLLYGQGVATSVIMEKSSKLMELFLLSTEPAAMVTGKVLAVALAGAIQFLSWALALICGFVAGTLAVKAVNPATDMMLISLFEEIGALSGMFSVGGIIVALLVLLSGFLLYCSLSAIGGALAGKPEDLSSTNLLFTLAIVVSFMIIVFGGGLTGNIGSLNPVLLWIPFTGVLAAPSQLILGELSVFAGIGILLVTVLVSLGIMLIAGRLYVAMVHHRGNPPKLSAAFAMLKKNN